MNLSYSVERARTRDGTTNVREFGDITDRSVFEVSVNLISRRLPVSEQSELLARISNGIAEVIEREYGGHEVNAAK